MAGIAVVNSGNYDLKIDTGFVQDAFILDNAISGVLDNTTYVLDGTTDFASVLDSTQSISVRRGRRDVGDSFSAGTMSFTILDVIGIFNPFDENSPFFDTNQLLADRTSRRVGERPQVGGTCVSPMAWPHCQREV